MAEGQGRSSGQGVKLLYIRDYLYHHATKEHPKNAKAIIKTDVTVGSVVTGNATDGEKVIFFKHCAGLQFKESGLTIGYLQFESPSMQMNNQSSNFFSENTFTFEENNGVSNAMMREVFYYVMELIENCVSGADVDVPEFPPLLAEYLNTKK